MEIGLDPTSELYEARNSAIGYDTEAAMDVLHADKIYLGELLCLSPEYRGCGLGTALTLQAGLRGCELKVNCNTNSTRSH